MTTGIAICAIAYDSQEKRYDSYSVHPEVTEYIDGVSPNANAGSYQDNGKWYQVDTSTQRCAVTAKASVTVNSEERPFSYWLYNETPNATRASRFRGRTFPDFKGEYGLIGLYYGVPARWSWVGEFGKLIEGIRLRLPRLAARMKIDAATPAVAHP